MSDQMLRFNCQQRLDSERFIDVAYCELITKPLAIVGRIYDRLGARHTDAKLGY